MTAATHNFHTLKKVQNPTPHRTFGAALTFQLRAHKQSRPKQLLQPYGCGVWESSHALESSNE